MSHKNDENSSSNLMNEVHKTSGTFKITVTELEELMGAYKERGSEFRDIKAIEKQQKELNKNIPYNVQFSKDYLWQIFYSETSKKYF